MSADDISAAEQRGYQKGYRAGARRKARDITTQQQYRERAAFLDRAYLALLPVAMTVQGWTMDGQPVSKTEERVRLAVAWARRALAQRPLP